MADQRTPRPDQTTGTPEDTVAIQLGGSGNGSAPSGGNRRVLPPLPPNAAPPAKRAPERSATTDPTPRAAKAPTRKPAATRSTPPKTPASGTTIPRAAAAAAAAAAEVPVVPAQPSASPSTSPSTRTTKTAKPAPKPAKAPTTTRKARLRLTRVDPWSVMKTAFLLSIALGIVVVVAVFMVWSVLDAADVWASINRTVAELVSDSNFDVEDYLGTRRVVGFAMIVAAVDVVLITAIATLGAFLYNMSASLLGGIEVTLAEDK